MGVANVGGLVGRGERRLLEREQQRDTDEDDDRADGSDRYRLTSEQAD